MARFVTPTFKMRVRGLKYDASRVNDVLSRIYARAAAGSLREIRKAFSLNSEEAGSLFGITRQGYRKWEADGVPTARLADVDRTVQLVRLMQRRLRPERLPALVRTPASDLGDRSVLQVVREDGPLAVMEYMRRQASGIPR